MGKKWVFEALVKNNRDAVGLIAYALYKNKKHALATSLRNAGRTEDQIQEEVKTFHDQTLHNDSISDYRDQAENYLNELFDRVASLERSKYEKEKAALEKKCSDQIKKEKAKLLKNIREYQVANKSLLDKLFNWLLSGVPGIVSSFVLTCVFLGASMLLVSESKRQEILAEAVSGYFGLTVEPKKPDSDNAPDLAIVK